ncbi:HD domain-containing protein [Anaeromicropila herbilytica]|uniref:Metal-dependent phosphohydrolase n=1 Tax=Anaeromicropila herbilytica TaxID=2785025 RepID=A0A7R7EKU5_9FIRM|nr:HD domain-containing protein [Anaeromicropila herbilytica]BCN30599.1 metal-dependent phosphohydrolase [Anaeromicropila herbilytica]
MTENIRKTNDFLKEKFYGNSDNEDYRYRYEHTLRTASIGQTIAREEGLDEEGLILACLLHDIGYKECKTEEDYNHHGRISERIAREFLESLDLEQERIETICYGIMIHTEETENLTRKPTIFELSVADADNIDRFDAYRLYINLQSWVIEKMTRDALEECADIRLSRYTEYRDIECATKIATRMWRDKISFQIEYFNRLKEQMNKMKEFQKELE